MPEVIALTERLFEDAQIERFSAHNPRENLARVEFIARDLGLTAVPYRGNVQIELGGAELKLDHVWVHIKEAQADYDVAWRLHDPEFVGLLRDPMPDDERALQMALRAQEDSFLDCILGEVPKGVKYSGDLFWGAKYANPERPRTERNRRVIAA